MAILNLVFYIGLVVLTTWAIGGIVVGVYQIQKDFDKMDETGDR